MPHTYNQDVLAEYMEEYSKALAEDCMISGIYESATLYAKKETDNLYNITFIAYEPKTNNQIIQSSTRIFSKLDKDKLIKTITTIYKIFQSRTNPPFISPNQDNTQIVIIFKNPGEWKITLDSLSNEEQSSILETLKKIS